MPNWKKVNDELRSLPSQQDQLRRKYLKRVHELTGRNVILYYSTWLDKQIPKELFPVVSIGDADMQAFMTTVNGLEKGKGLDLILHTPGGDIAATESIVKYLKKMFNNDINVYVPQVAMSAGTLIALSSQIIYMGKHSSLGPIDPQLNGINAIGVIDEFKKAREEINEDIANAPLWAPILSKYPPAFVGNCTHAWEWSKKLAKDWLTQGTLVSDNGKIDNIISQLTEQKNTRSHGRHFDIDYLRTLGLNIIALEDNHELQDAILSVFHAAKITANTSSAYKIVENHNGIANIVSVNIS